MYVGLYFKFFVIYMVMVFMGMKSVLYDMYYCVFGISEI